MEISFTTKEESKKIAREEFLALSPMERFWTFVRLSYYHNILYGVPKDRHKNSFVITRKKK